MNYNENENKNEKQNTQIRYNSGLKIDTNILNIKFVGKLIFIQVMNNTCTA